VVHVLFADSPERVERVFSRHDVLILARPHPNDQFVAGILATLFFLNLAAIVSSSPRLRRDVRQTSRCHS
jgi:hypothetical protein